MSMWQRVSMRRVEFGLLLLGALIMAVTVVNLELSQGNELSSSVLWVIGGYFGVFSIAHLALCFLAPYADQLMLPVAALLNGLGLIMINRLDVARGTRHGTEAGHVGVGGHCVDDRRITGGAGLPHLVPLFLFAGFGGFGAACATYGVAERNQC